MLKILFLVSQFVYKLSSFRAFSSDFGARRRNFKGLLAKIDEKTGKIFCIK